MTPQIDHVFMVVKDAGDYVAAILDDMETVAMSKSASYDAQPTELYKVAFDSGVDLNDLMGKEADFDLVTAWIAQGAIAKQAGALSYEATHAYDLEKEAIWGAVANLGRAAVGKVGQVVQAVAKPVQNLAAKIKQPPRAFDSTLDKGVREVSNAGNLDATIGRIRAERVGKNVKNVNSQLNESMTLKGTGSGRVQDGLGRDVGKLNVGQMNVRNRIRTGEANYTGKVQGAKAAPAPTPVQQTPLAQYNKTQQQAKSAPPAAKPTLPQSGTGAGVPGQQRSVFGGQASAPEVKGTHTGFPLSGTTFQVQGGKAKVDALAPHTREAHGKGSRVEANAAPQPGVDHPNVTAPKPTSAGSQAAATQSGNAPAPAAGGGAAAPAAEGEKWHQKVLHTTQKGTNITQGHAALAGAGLLGAGGAAGGMAAGGSRRREE